MKVLDLQCSAGHRFEAWFGSEADFQSQREGGLLECPLCGNTVVEKLPSAPRLNLMTTRTSPPPTEAAPPGTQPPVPAHVPKALPVAGATQLEGLHAAWLALSRHAMAHSEDVGPRFAEEARRIHYGESDARSIRGQTTVQEAHALQEEGIDVLPIAIPALQSHTLH